MIAVKQALDIIAQQTTGLADEEVTILEACGCILAEEVFSDIDMPPFDKSSMDGYAVRSRDLTYVPAELQQVGFIAAGVSPDFSVQPGQAAKIMTGAPMPKGADSVQMVEKTESVGVEAVRILESVANRQNVALKGEIFRNNERVLAKGTYISPAVIGVLACVGKASVKVYKRPRVGILVTGSELVEVNIRPAPAQIRNSNGYALYHQVLETGGRPEQLGVAPDDPDKLTRSIEAGLKNDVLLVSGGVSMGDLDLVENVFENLGVKVLFEKVNMKPGKPLVFGRKDETLVFGLPGNPVSTSTVFEVFVKPALLKMMGFPHTHNPVVPAVLRQDFETKTKRELYHPARSFLEDGRFFVEPILSRGSADILAFSKSNAFLVVRSGVRKLEAGATVPVMLRNDFWRSPIVPNSFGRPESD